MPVSRLPPVQSWDPTSVNPRFSPWVEMVSLKRGHITKHQYNSSEMLSWRRDLDSVVLDQICYPGRHAVFWTTSPFDYVRVTLCSRRGRTVCSPARPPLPLLGLPLGRSPSCSFVGQRLSSWREGAFRLQDSAASRVGLRSVHAIQAGVLRRA